MLQIGEVCDASCTCTGNLYCIGKTPDELFKERSDARKAEMESFMPFSAVTSSTVTWICDARTATVK